MSKKLANYVDGYGYVCKQQPEGAAPHLEGGDTCANEGTLQYCGLHREEQIKGLFLHRDIPVRHPDPGMWYSNPTRTSRDQLIPLLCAFIRDPEVFKEERKKLFRAHLKHALLFAFNIYPNWVPEYKAKLKVPDLTGPEFWALWIRAFRVRQLYPLLYLFDIETLLSIIYTKLFRKEDHDLRNSALVVHAARYYMPTLISLLTKYIAGNKMFLEAFKRFWGNDVYEPPIDKYMKHLYND